MGSVIAAITGTSGHVGASLSRSLLAAGERVRLLVHEDTRALEDLSAERVQADLTDPHSLRRAFEDVEIVFHLAASISLDRRHVETLRRINIEGTRHVIQACRDCSVRRLVHFSSIEALADLNPRKATDENNPLAGPGDTTLYGWTKAEAERLVLQAAADSLDAVILSPTAILGPYDFKPSHLGRSLLDLYHKRLPALIHGGFNWVDVRDVVDGTLAAAQLGHRGERYILGGTWRSLPEMAALVKETTGRETARAVLPVWLARTAAAIAGGLPALSSKYPAFTPDALVAIGKHRKISCEKAERELGYKPRPLEQTLRDTFSWFREQGLLEE
ncbi:MAG: NAD-dependent epimerase/dehydratase family protein [Spirochaetaceae bacterium]|nr:MAG: NAD-dependent epimerase/dehydratase family protein [Spirochaetaceae bacterium]